MRIKIPNELLRCKNIIYFLYLGEEIVYIGESSIGIGRVFQHMWDKEFDGIEIEEAPSDLEERRAKEESYILKYLPPYNSYKFNALMRSQGYWSVGILKRMIRMKCKDSYRITNSFKRLTMENCRMKKIGTVTYINLEDIQKIIHREIGEDFII